MSLLPLRFFVALTIVASEVLTVDAFAQTLTVLPALDQAGVLSVSNAISGNGLVAVGAAYAGTSFRATQWTAGSQPQIFPGVGFLSEAFAVNYDGSVVVGENGASAFRWTATGGAQNLGSMAGGSWASALGVSADGSVVVGVGSTTDDPSNPFSPVYSRAFRWTASGGMQSIGALTSSSNSQAFGVNADGSVIVGESNNQAFRWTNSGMVGLGYLSGASASQASAISAAGDVVIGHSGQSAFRWTASAGMQALQGLTWLSSGQYFASALTADGSFVVGQHGSQAIAMIWDAAGQPATLADYLSARGVSMLGWSQLNDATGISADGRFITGRGIYEGQNRAFIADIGVIPAPGAAPVLAIAGLAVRGRRRR